MLPPVESDELLVAHGLYEQKRQGESTKLQEFWSVHSLPDEAMIWRSQLIYDGLVPISACYLIRNPLSRPVQMVFYWRWPDGRDDMIEYRFALQHLTVLHQNQVQEMILPVDYQVYGWHTVTENLLWLGYNRTLGGQQTINMLAPGIQQGTLWPTLLQMNAEFDRVEIAPGLDGPFKAVSFFVDMPEVGAQRLYFDEFGVPVRWILPQEDLLVELVEYRRTG
jgi:hypothetical protein